MEKIVIDEYLMGENYSIPIYGPFSLYDPFLFLVENEIYYLSDDKKFIDILLKTNNESKYQQYFSNILKTENREFLIKLNKYCVVKNIFQLNNLDYYKLEIVYKLGIFSKEELIEKLPPRRVRKLSFLMENQIL